MCTAGIPDRANLTLSIVWDTIDRLSERGKSCFGWPILDDAPPQRMATSKLWLSIPEADDGITVECGMAFVVCFDGEVREIELEGNELKLT